MNTFLDFQYVIEYYRNAFLCTFIEIYAKFKFSMSVMLDLNFTTLVKNVGVGPFRFEIGIHVPK